MKILPLIAATTVAALFAGCVGTSPTRVVGNTIGVAGGALLGSTLGKQNSLATVAEECWRHSPVNADQSGQPKTTAPVTKPPVNSSPTPETNYGNHPTPSP